MRGMRQDMQPDNLPREQKKERPLDLEKKSLMLSGLILEMTGKAKKGQGRKIAQRILSSGKAMKKFQEIIKAQGGNLPTSVLNALKAFPPQALAPLQYPLTNEIRELLSSLFGG